MFNCKYNIRQLCVCVCVCVCACVQNKKETSDLYM